MKTRLKNRQWRLLFLLLTVLILGISSSRFAMIFFTTTTSIVEANHSQTSLFRLKSNLILPLNFNTTEINTNTRTNEDFIPLESSPYHDWKLFASNFEEMIQNFKIYIYPIKNQSNSSYAPVSSSSFSHIFLPHTNPSNPKLGNYYSEHIFKIALFHSSLLTLDPEKAHLYFLPFSVNLLRNDRRVHSEESISNFVAKYTNEVSKDFPYWNISGGADHFYVCCHSVCRDAVSKHHGLHNNAIQVTCSSSYFQRFYVSHKDVSLPQIWPRPLEPTLNPPHARDRLVFFAGRIQNSKIREDLITLWGNDSDIDIFSGSPTFPYEEGFRRSKYCLHVKGYEVNTARLIDAIHYGCIPVVISNHYELPFANVLDWTKFSVIIVHTEVALLKNRLLSITREMYLNMFHNLCSIRKHFVWHEKPKGYDAFHMTAYQLWLRKDRYRLFH